MGISLNRCYAKHNIHTTCTKQVLFLFAQFNLAKVAPCIQFLLAYHIKLLYTDSTTIWVEQVSGWSIGQRSSQKSLALILDIWLSGPIFQRRWLEWHHGFLQQKHAILLFHHGSKLLVLMYASSMATNLNVDLHTMLHH